VLKRRYIFFVAVGLLIIFGIPTLIYVYHFWGSKLSHETGDWGAFSDYLNPWFSLANLVALIILTVTIANFDEDRENKTRQHQTQIEKENRLFQRKIYLTEARRAALKNYSEFRDEFFDKLFVYEKTKKKSEILMLVTKFEGLHQQNIDLFSILGTNEPAKFKAFVGNILSKSTSAEIEIKWIIEWYASFIKSLQSEMTNEWNEPNPN
jgi:hypothetical protein